jgi:hypothetical protein
MRVGSFILGASLLFASSSGWSDSAQDLALVANALQPYIHQINNPIVVYNWAAYNPKFDPGRSDNPANYYHMIGESMRYWDHQNDAPNGAVTWGSGLYVATDPVSTQSYGGSNWVLNQITLPSGFTFIDTSPLPNQNITTPDAVYQALGRLGCPFSSSDGFTLSADMMNPSRYYGSASCAAAIKQIVQQMLGIDAFMYPYVSTQFADCVAGANAGQAPHGSALVIISGNKLSQAGVRSFDAATTDDAPDRALIESLFYRSMGGDYPSIISSQNPPPGAFGAGLLWSDLDGTSTDSQPQLSNWMQTYLLGCNPQPNFQMSQLTAGSASAICLPQDSAPNGGLDRFAGVIEKATSVFLQPNADL